MALHETAGWIAFTIASAWSAIRTKAWLGLGSWWLSWTWLALAISLTVLHVRVQEPKPGTVPPFQKPKAGHTEWQINQYVNYIYSTSNALRNITCQSELINSTGHLKIWCDEHNISTMMYDYMKRCGSWNIIDGNWFDLLFYPLIKVLCIDSYLIIPHCAVRCVCSSGMMPMQRYAVPR